MTGKGGRKEREELREPGKPYGKKKTEVENMRNAQKPDRGRDDAKRRTEGGRTQDLREKNLTRSRSGGRPTENSRSRREAISHGQNGREKEGHTARVKAFVDGRETQRPSDGGSDDEGRKRGRWDRPSERAKGEEKTPWSVATENNGDFQRRSDDEGEQGRTEREVGENDQHDKGIASGMTLNYRMGEEKTGRRRAATEKESEVMGGPRRGKPNDSIFKTGAKREEQKGRCAEVSQCGESEARRGPESSGCNADSLDRHKLTWFLGSTTHTLVRGKNHCPSETSKVITGGRNIPGMATQASKTTSEGGEGNEEEQRSREGRRSDGKAGGGGEKDEEAKGEKNESSKRRGDEQQTWAQ